MYKLITPNQLTTSPGHLSLAKAQILLCPVTSVTKVRFFKYFLVQSSSSAVELLSLVEVVFSVVVFASAVWVLLLGVVVSVVVFVVVASKLRCFYSVK